jgi:predicted AAA+ superfamily ATPase
VIIRNLQKEIIYYFDEYPVIAIVGARQVGKSTLAKSIISNYNNAIYLDAERPSHRQLLDDAEQFFELNHDKLICIDEVQNIPDIFSVIRSIVDDNKSIQFLILGSASPEVLQQSESLAGRIAYFELPALQINELKQDYSFKKYLFRGALPKSFLSKKDESAFFWLQNFIVSFLERDLRQFGFDIPFEILHRLWIMLAHNNGQQIKYSTLSLSLGVSHTTVRNYVEILSQTFMLRTIQPYYINIKKRIVKSPKVYIRDVGILNALLNIRNFNELYSHPVFGSAWELVVIENIIHKFNDWNYFYYRTTNGNEIDLILTKADKVVAIEIKVSVAPKVTRGFWTALDDVKADKAYIVAPVQLSYPMKNNVSVMSLEDIIALDNLV